MNMQTENISDKLEKLNKLQKTGISLFVLSLFILFILNLLSENNLLISLITNFLVWVPSFFLIFVIILSISTYYIEYKKRYDNN
jgi:hypothetical protein